MDAITTLINQCLHPKGITAKASLKNGSLQVMLESTQVADEQRVVYLIREMLMYLGIRSLKKVKIYGRKTGEDFPDWQQEFKQSPEETSCLVVKYARSNFWSYGLARS